MNDTRLRTAGLALLSSCLAACAQPQSATSTATLASADTTALVQRLDRLDARRQQLEDANAIRRLQAAYGYYLDRGLWDEAAALFAADGSIEMGLDGVYVGQARVRQYLYALGGGHAGLAPGQLNEHMQVMPYVTVAADGQSARATWRDISLTGRLGQDAFWGEGPYENTYVKDHGVWKIKTLHWFQTLVVPYEGGWAKHPDVNGGRYVSATLPPDRPPSVQYRTWPGGLLPPFHFDQPDAGMSETTGAAAAGAPPQDTSPRALNQRLAVLAQQVRLLAAQDEIEKLQRTWGYYLDKGLWSEAASLFSDDGAYELQSRGIYTGKAHILQYLRAIGPEGPQAGRLFDHLQLQDVVHVAPDGLSAKGRWRVFSQGAILGRFAEWGMEIIEADYVWEGGVWKIRRMRVYPVMFTPYADGWGKTQHQWSSFEPALAPDRPPEALPHNPDSVAPFHYDNPVTGKAVYPGTAADFAVPARFFNIATLSRQAADLDRKLTRLEDVNQLENLQMRYGYYLATLQWDSLANLFAEDGTIQIALRGVYAGRAHVRRNLDLYGEPGVHEGNLHNHMQFQPVIDVAPDGRTAKIRARALSMMGNYGKAGMWMGGIYENQFTKVNGVWKFQHDQVFNNYFASYEQGWENAPPRDPPGITASNPPDAPPTVIFQMYPHPTYYPDFHYPNPVTGQPVQIPRTP